MDFPRIVLAALLLPVVVGCESEPLKLPDPPAQVSIAGFSPPSGYAGARVTITGQGLAGDPSAIDVRVGSGRPVAPLEVAPDGTRLVFEVPDDATSGSVSVTTPAGRATSAARFDWKGLGRLRVGSVRATTDLRLPLLDVAAMPSATGEAQVAVIVDDTLAAVFADPDAGAYTVRPLVDWRARVRALAGGPGGAQWYLADGGRYCSEGQLFLGRADLDDFEACLDDSPVPTTSGLLARLVVSPDGAHVAATLAGVVWRVDVAPRRVRRTVLDDSDSVTDTPVAFTAEGALALVAANSLYLLEWEAGEAEDQFVDAAPELAVIHGNRVALVQEGDVVLLDATTWPPTEVERFYSFGPFPESLEFSDDGRRLAITDDSGTYQVFDIDGPARTLAGGPLEEPGRVRRGVRGTFLIPVRGAVAVVAQESGTLVARVPVARGLGPPVIRRVVRHATFEPEWVVTLPSLNLGELLQLDGERLNEDVFFHYDLDVPFVSGLTAARDAGTLLYRRLVPHLFESDEHTVHRLSRVACVEPACPAGEFVEREVTTPLLSLGDGDDLTGGDPSFAISPDGRAAAYQFATGSVFSKKWRVAVFDPTGTSSQVTTLDGDATRFGTPPSPLFAGDGRLWISGDSSVSAYDGAALPGTATKLFSRELTSRGSKARTLDMAAGPGGLFVLNRPDGLPTEVFGPRSLSIVGDDGTVATGPEITDWQPYFATTIGVPAGGRWMYTVQGNDLADSKEPTALVPFKLDPVTATVSERAEPIPLPEGARDFAVFPDGEHLVIVDAVNDRVMLVE